MARTTQSDALASCELLPPMANASTQARSATIGQTHRVVGCGFVSVTHSGSQALAHGNPPDKSLRASTKLSISAGAVRGTGERSYHGPPIRRSPGSRGDD